MLQDIKVYPRAKSLPNRYKCHMFINHMLVPGDSSQRGHFAIVTLEQMNNCYLQHELE